MSNPVKRANVYYLTPPATPVAPPPPARWSAVRRTLLRTWWRLRLALAALHTRVGRRRPRALAGDDLFLDADAEPVAWRRPRPSGPARIIDLNAARLRRRPLAP